MWSPICKDTSNHDDANWISVEDAVPSDDRSVLVTDGKSIGFGSYKEPSNPGDSTDYWVSDDVEKVTHWISYRK